MWPLPMFVNEGNKFFRAIKFETDLGRVLYIEFVRFGQAECLE